jgi:proline dehydrogenase
VLRAILLYLSKARWALRLITSWRFARRASARFIAGDTLEDALRLIQVLNQRGMYATLDHLGENVDNLDKAALATQDYLDSLPRIKEIGVEANISIKLTQLGLNIDFNACQENLERLAEEAAELGIMVRIDIEDSTTVARNWQIFRALRAKGCINIGLAIQAYLNHGEEYTRALVAEGAHFRLCKGAYKEPPEIALQRKADVDANFDRLATILMDAALTDGSDPILSSGNCPPVTAIATHDDARIEFARTYASEIGLPKWALEFQMLLGIRNDLQKMLVEAGYPVRIYVPYGTDWYPFFMRRLAERPANLWFFVSNLIRR